MKKTILTAGVAIATIGLALSTSSPAHAAAPWQASWIGVSKSPSDAELPEIVVAKALYGVRGDPTKQVDLTASVRQNIASGNFTLRADNATAGRDPAYGAEKTLELEYTINGRAVRQSVKENSKIDLVTGQMATNQNEPPVDKPPVGSNQWICYRKTIKLAEAPAQAMARIAVDSKYWLWINGEPVVFEGQLKRGPTPKDTYFDRVDLTKYLRQGDNTIAVLVWYFGKDGFSHKSSGKAGLVFDAEINGQPFLSGADWKARRHPSYENTGEPHPNFRLSEPNICFDARKDMADWQSAAFDDSSWPAAVVFGKPPCAPWNQLVERPIPQWKDFGMKDYVNAADLPKVSDGKPIKAKLPYNAQITPYLKIESPAGQVIDLRMDNQALRAEYVTREGVQEYESLGWMSGHEVHYTIPAGIKILGLKYRETGYDTQFAGTFECDDEFLNRYREKALRTLYVNMRDTYMDCPERERAQWWGDVVNMMGQAFYSLTPDTSRLTRKGMFELTNWQTDDHVLFAPIPGNWKSELKCQMLNSVGYFGFWTYYLYTGDLETIRSVYPAVKRYMSLWKIGDDGLLVSRGGSWTDWGENKDHPVLFNAWYYLALRGQKLMAEALGETADIPDIEARMGSIEKNFNKTFWTGTEYRSPGYKDKTDDRCHALAVLTGLAGPDKYEAIRKVFATQEHSSPYMEKYVGEALYQMRFEEDAIARTKKRFKDMVEDPKTTLWELWNKAGTQNHAWSGGFLTILSQYGAGVAPVTPGYGTYHVLPQMGPLKRIKTIVPSVKGEIALELRNEPAEFALDLVSPKDTTAIVGIPKREGASPARITANGKPVWENGQPTGAVDGVAFKENGEHYTTFSVQPGTWAFRAEFSPAPRSGENSGRLRVLDGKTVLMTNTRNTDDVAASWLLENVPFFECPNREIEEIYYYRWWSYHKNLRKEKAGWAVLEGGGYGITPCPLGHHLYEGRWIKNRVYLDDYIRYWFAGDNPRRYSTWFADGCYAQYLVDGDSVKIVSYLKGLIANQEGWERERFDSARGLFRWIPDRDGMEASLAGFEAGEADKFQWNTVIFGGDGYRPSLNSYMVADMRAIAAIATLAGDQAVAGAYTRKAEALRTRMQQELWCPEKNFFLQRHSQDYRFVSGREQIGFFPWAFHVPDDNSKYAEAWRQLQDPQGFKAKYGPTTLERRNTYFLKPFKHKCLWNGPSWPYSTSVTLAAMANLLNDYKQSVVTRDDYVALLHTYAATQRDPDGKPMVRENHHPDENGWLAKGGDYNHSRYCDLVITGLVGLRPRGDGMLEVNPLAPADWEYFCLDGVVYHGRTLTILYDRSGNRYGRGAGLRILIDGAEAARAATIQRITVALE